MNISELRESKFLKRNDVGEGTVVTITGVDQSNVAKEGAPEEMKWILHVAEFDKGLVLNSTNGQLIAQALKSEESEDWIGQKVVLYDDPSVSFGGKLVGGIRVRAVPKSQQAAPTQRPAEGTYRKPEASGSFKAQLKSKFRAHPKFNKDLKPDDVNDFLVKKFSAKLDELPEEIAQELLGNFETLVEDILEASIPF